MPLSPAVLPLREAAFSNSISVPLSRAAGKIAAEIACPCPPGIPVVMPGERITGEAAEFLRNYGFLNVKVVK